MDELLVEQLAGDVRELTYKVSDLTEVVELLTAQLRRKENGDDNS
tara:strand:+ start:319 stop:453 length:135 start_codon:yes stop_codon:yes gene_type:complete